MEIVDDDDDDAVSSARRIPATDQTAADRPDDRRMRQRTDTAAAGGVVASWVCDCCGRVPGNDDPHGARGGWEGGRGYYYSEGCAHEEISLIYVEEVGGQ